MANEQEVYCEEIEDIYCDVIRSTTDVPQSLRQSETNTSQLQSPQTSSKMSISRKQVILISVMTALAIFLVLSVVFMAMFLTSVGKSKPSVCRSDLANVTIHDDGETKLLKSTSCAELYKKGEKLDGVYTIDPDGFGAFNVRCDMTTSGGGWTIFQRRIDGRVDFYRKWNNYQKGFGTLYNEFWLGLDKINRLTESGQNVLRVDMEDFENVTRYAEYKTFDVSNEANKYKLTIGRYSGNAGDSLIYANGMKFSTRDMDNDRAKGNCAHIYKGCWWYNRCHSSNLNGQYLRGNHSTRGIGINWHHWKGSYYSLKKTEMKIRPRSF